MVLTRIPAARRLLTPNATRRLLAVELSRQQRPALSYTVCTSSSRSFSSPATQEPSRYVQGVTTKDLESDPNIASFFAANFVDEDENEEDDDEEFVLTIDGEEVVEEGAEETTDDELTQDVADPALLARNIRPLSCYVRSREREDGTRACNKLREVHKLIPGILYGSDPTKSIISKYPDSKTLIKTPWNQIQRELDRYHHAFESRVYELSVYESQDNSGAGEEEGLLYKQLVVPSDMQRHPIKNKLFCVNYLRYHPGRPIKIPIRYINEEESPALKRGGFIVPINRTIECFVEDGAVIPESIDLECTGIQMKQVLRTERLVWPEGVTPSHRVKDDYLVGLIYGKRQEEEEEAGEDAEGAEEASSS